MKILVIVLIVSGVDFGRALPSVWQWCIDNRFYSCVLIFMICNAIEGQLISSGAFEIHFNGAYHSYLNIMFCKIYKDTQQPYYVYQNIKYLLITFVMIHSRCSRLVKT